MLAANNQDKEAYEDIYLSKKGSDIVVLMDYNGKLDTMNITAIRDELLNLSIAEDVEINITTYNTDLTGKSIIRISTGGIPSDFVSTGKRFFLVENNSKIIKFGVIQHRIWQK
ncbi:hypothetical protein JXC34_07380 [Candidatus Woesearchaeota archaeon]|nr:hypothetical protein [Candidatus Woesearchaeota archaeon]